MIRRFVKPAKPLAAGVLVLFLLVISSGAALAAGPQPSVFPGDQLPPDSYVAEEFLVKFKSGVSQQAIERLNIRNGVTEFKSDSWGLLRASVPKSKSIWQVLAAYANHQDVEYVELNSICRATMTPNDYFYKLQWNLDNSATGGIHMQKAWDLSTGSGVTVAVLDTGIAYENYDENGDGQLDYWLAPDLAQTRFVPGYDFINNDAHANDDNSHGTHVAGTIGQSTNNVNPGSKDGIGEGTAGIAYGATLMPVKVLDANGTGSAYSLAQGIRYAADHGAKVINMSLGWPFFFGRPLDAGRSVRDAVTYAHNKGVTLVAAASNDGKGYVAYPAAYPECIAVGATQYDENLTPYTNWGSALDIMAPGGNTGLDQNNDTYGDGILQQTFNPNTKNRSDFWYWFFGGTSMSSPHVAGVAALVISAGVTDPAAVKQVLYSTAEDHGTAGWDSRYGWGIVDAYAALASLAPANKPPVANGQAITTSEDGAISITLGASDSDGDPLTFGVVSGPAHGSLTVMLPNISYSPAANYNGPDSFTFKANDGKADSNTATVSITVTEVNDPPLAQNDYLTTYQNTLLPISVSTLLANDSPGPANEASQILTLYSVTPPSHGSVSYGGGIVTYIPTVGYVGPDSFTYTIQDNGTNNSVGSPLRATGTVSITVAANRAPVANAGGPYSGMQGGPVIFNGSSSSDVDGDALTYSWAFGDGTNGSGVTPSHIYASQGTYTVTLTVNDGKVNSAPSAAQVTIAALPVASAFTNITMSKQGFWGFWRTTATVSLSSAGSPLTGATVYGTWSGSYNASVAGMTASNGTVSFGSNYAMGAGTMRFTIARVVKDGKDYTISGELADFMIGP